MVADREEEEHTEDPVIVSTLRVILLGAVLVLVGALGFYTLPGLIDPNADGTKLVNAFYCSVMTLTTVGYGDICPYPPDMTSAGRAFILLLSFGGLGMFCGPVMDLAAIWKDQIPGGLFVLMPVTLAAGIVMFTTLEALTGLEALYYCVISFTTIGYGDTVPQTDPGKIATALYAMLAINVAAAFMEPAKEILMKFCQMPIKRKDKEKSMETGKTDLKKTE